MWEAYYSGDMEEVAGQLRKLRKLNPHWYRTTAAEINDMIDQESESYDEGN